MQTEGSLTLLSPTKKNTCQSFSWDQRSKKEKVEWSSLNKNTQ
jgi:hypothetical protein